MLITSSKPSGRYPS